MPHKFDNNKFKLENNGFIFKAQEKNITFNSIIDSINNKQISANNL